MDLPYIQVDCYINSLLEFSLYFKPLLPVYSLDHLQSTLVPHLLEVTCEQSFRKMDGDKGVTSMCFFFLQECNIRPCFTRPMVFGPPYFNAIHSRRCNSYIIVYCGTQISPILGCQWENKGARWNSIMHGYHIQWSLQTLRPLAIIALVPSLHLPWYTQPQAFLVS